MATVLIKNGRIVTAVDDYQADILLRDERSGGKQGFHQFHDGFLPKIIALRALNAPSLGRTKAFF